MHGLPSRPSPGPQALLYWRVRVAASESIFLKRKSTKPSGIPRGIPPWHAFAFFLRVKKEGGPQARLCCGMSAHTMRHPAEKDVECAATSFLRVEKGYKETPGALPPDPQVIGRFSIQENRHCRFFLNRRPYSKGARGPRGPVGRGTETI